MTTLAVHLLMYHAYTPINFESVGAHTCLRLIVQCAPFIPSLSIALLWSCYGILSG